MRKKNFRVVSSEGNDHGATDDARGKGRRIRCDPTAFSCAHDVGRIDLDSYIDVVELDGEFFVSGEFEATTTYFASGVQYWDLGGHDREDVGDCVECRLVVDRIRFLGGGKEWKSHGSAGDAVNRYNRRAIDGGRRNDGIDIGIGGIDGIEIKKADSSSGDPFNACGAAMGYGTSPQDVDRNAHGTNFGGGENRHT